MTRVVLLSLLALAAAPAALGHGSATAIGRAVEALQQVDVSYDPAAAVSEIEAGQVELLAGDGVYAAFLPAAAMGEVQGGARAVAEEVAREAGVRGTLVALVGTRLAAVSTTIPRSRLDELVRESSGGTPATRTAALVRRLRADEADTSRGLPWGWLAAVATVLLGAGGVLTRSRVRGLAARRP